MLAKHLAVESSAVRRAMLVVAVFGLLCTASSGVARADLYAHWPLNDGMGDEAQDVGPRGENALIYDAMTGGLGPDGNVWVSDPDRGTVLGFAGTSAWVEAGDLPMMDLENNFSWAFWARQDPDQVTPANDIIIGNRYNAAGADTVPREFIKFTPNQFEYHIDGAGTNNLQYASLDIPSNDQWIHHAVTKVGDTFTYYRNGEAASASTMQEEMLSPDPFPFAMGGQGGAEAWRGYLSDIQLYESGLDPAGIATVMSGSTLEDQNLYSHWPLNDGSGDEAGNLVDGGDDGLIYDFDIGGLGDDGSVWVNDPDRGTVLGLAGTSAWVEAGYLPMMDFENEFTWAFWRGRTPSNLRPTTISSSAIGMTRRVWTRCHGSSSSSPRISLSFI